MPDSHIYHREVHPVATGKEATGPTPLGKVHTLLPGYFLRAVGYPFSMYAMVPSKEKQCKLGKGRWGDEGDPDG